MRVTDGARDAAYEICGKYLKPLKRDLENFFEQEVNFAIPVINAAIKKLEQTGSLDADDLEGAGGNNLNKTAVEVADATAGDAKAEVAEEGESEEGAPSRTVYRTLYQSPPLV